jgi:hypothetical protein
MVASICTDVISKVLREITAVKVQYCASCSIQAAIRSKLAHQKFAKRRTSQVLVLACITQAMVSVRARYSMTQQKLEQSILCEKQPNESSVLINKPLVQTVVQTASTQSPPPNNQACARKRSYLGSTHLDDEAVQVFNERPWSVFAKKIMHSSAVVIQNFVRMKQAMTVFQKGLAHAISCLEATAALQNLLEYKLWQAAHNRDEKHTSATMVQSLWRRKQFSARRSLMQEVHTKARQNGIPTVFVTACIEKALVLVYRREAATFFISACFEEAKTNVKIKANDQQLSVTGMGCAFSPGTISACVAANGAPPLERFHFHGRELLAGVAGSRSLQPIYTVSHDDCVRAFKSESTKWKSKRVRTADFGVMFMKGNVGRLEPMRGNSRRAQNHGAASTAVAAEIPLGCKNLRTSCGGKKKNKVPGAFIRRDMSTSATVLQKARLIDMQHYDVHQKRSKVPSQLKTITNNTETTSAVEQHHAPATRAQGRPQKIPSEDTRLIDPPPVEPTTVVAIQRWKNRYHSPSLRPSREIQHDVAKPQLQNKKLLLQPKVVSTAQKNMISAAACPPFDRAACKCFKRTTHAWPNSKSVQLRSLVSMYHSADLDSIYISAFFESASKNVLFAIDADTARMITNVTISDNSFCEALLKCLVPSEAGKFAHSESRVVVRPKGESNIGVSQANQFASSGAEPIKARAATALESDSSENTHGTGLAEVVLMKVRIMCRYCVTISAHFKSPPPLKPEVDVATVLQLIDTYMQKNRIRCVDLFRRRLSAPSQSDDVSLNTNELKSILLQMGMDLSHENAQLVVNLLDANGDGRVDVLELSTVLKAARRDTKKEPMVTDQRPQKKNEQPPRSRHAREEQDVVVSVNFVPAGNKKPLSAPMSLNIGFKKATKANLSLATPYQALLQNMESLQPPKHESLKPATKAPLLAPLTIHAWSLELLLKLIVTSPSQDSRSKLCLRDVPKHVKKASRLTTDGTNNKIANLHSQNPSQRGLTPQLQTRPVRQEDVKWKDCCRAPKQRLLYKSVGLVNGQQLLFSIFTRNEGAGKPHTMRIAAVSACSQSHFLRTLSPNDLPFIWWTQANEAKEGEIMCMSTWPASWAEHLLARVRVDAKTRKLGLLPLPISTHRGKRFTMLQIMNRRRSQVPSTKTAKIRNALKNRRNRKLQQLCEDAEKQRAQKAGLNKAGLSFLHTSASVIQRFLRTRKSAQRPNSSRPATATEYKSKTQFKLQSPSSKS